LIDPPPFVVLLHQRTARSTTDFEATSRSDSAAATALLNSSPERLTATKTRRRNLALLHFGHVNRNDHRCNTMDSNSSSLSAVARAKDEDIGNNFLDLRDDKCESNKTSAAIKQFNFFLKGCCNLKGHTAFLGCVPTTEQIPATDWKESMVTLTMSYGGVTSLETSLTAWF